MEPKREKSRGATGIDESAIAGSNMADQSALMADKKELDMTIDEIMDEKAFIWVCGRNVDGELGMGPVTKGEESVKIPKNVK